jgi:hypothetical protein
MAGASCKIEPVRLISSFVASALRHYERSHLFGLGLAPTLVRRASFPEHSSFHLGGAPINCAPTVFPGMSECTTQIKMCPEESIYLFISKEKFYGQPYFLRTGIQVKRNGEVALCVFVLPDTTGGSACSLWRIILNDHWHTNGPAIHRRMAAGELRLFEHS